MSSLMSASLANWVVLAAATLCVACDAGALAATDSLAAKENDQYKVVVKIVEVSTSGGSLSLPQAVLTNKRSGGVFEVRLDSAVTEVKDVLFGSEVVVILGSVPVGEGETPVEYVGSINTSDGRLQQAWAHAVSVSPSGDMVAYSNFVPRHPGRGNMGSKWFVFSLKEPGAPRHLILPENPYPKVPDDTPLEVYIWTGKRVLLWSPDSAVLLFFVQRGTFEEVDDSRFFRVAVDLRQGLSKPRVLLEPIPRREIGHTPSHDLSSFYVDDLQNTGEDTLTVKYTEGGGAEAPIKELKLKWSEILREPGTATSTSEISRTASSAP